MFVTCKLSSLVVYRTYLYGSAECINSHINGMLRTYADQSFQSKIQKLVVYFGGVKTGRKRKVKLKISKRQQCQVASDTYVENFQHYKLVCSQGAIWG